MSTSYGCPKANLNSTLYPMYQVSCLYNCAENLKAKSVQYSNVRSCVNTYLPYYDRICYDQTINCLTDSTLNCVASANTAFLCANSTTSNNYCAIANNKTNTTTNTTTDYPAYGIACLSTCLNNTQPVNGSPVFISLQNCMSTFDGYECGAQLNNCLEDPSQYCVGYLNTALICSQNNTSCEAAFSNQEAANVTQCNSQCF